MVASTATFLQTAQQEHFAPLTSSNFGRSTSPPIHHCAGLTLTCSAPIQNLITISFQIGHSENSQSGDQMKGLALKNSNLRICSNETPHQSRWCCLLWKDAAFNCIRRYVNLCVRVFAEVTSDQQRQGGGHKNKKPLVTYFMIGQANSPVTRRNQELDANSLHVC